jgi:hypothetical protein
MDNVTEEYKKWAAGIHGFRFGEVIRKSYIADSVREKVKTMSIIDETTCYINFDDADVLSWAFDVSKLISSTLSLKVLFRFDSVEMIVDKNTTYDSVNKQYKDGLKKHKDFLANSDFKYYLNDLNWNNLNEINEYLDCYIVDAISSINGNNKNLLVEKLINKYYEETDKNTYVKTRLGKYNY